MKVSEIVQSTHIIMLLFEKRFRVCHLFRTTFHIGQPLESTSGCSPMCEKRLLLIQQINANIKHHAFNLSCYYLIAFFLLHGHHVQSTLRARQSSSTLQLFPSSIAYRILHHLLLRFKAATLRDRFTNIPAYLIVRLTLQTLCKY